MMCQAMLTVNEFFDLTDARGNPAKALDLLRADVALA
jgi:hypothetical protein